MKWEASLSAFNLERTKPRLTVQFTKAFTQWGSNQLVGYARKEVIGAARIFGNSHLVNVCIKDVWVANGYMVTHASYSSAYDTLSVNYEVVNPFDGFDREALQDVKQVGGYLEYIWKGYSDFIDDFLECEVSLYSGLGDRY